MLENGKTIENFYKELTSNFEQRESFRKHFFNAIVNKLQINDIFDGYLHDLLTILTQDPANTHELYIKMIKACSHVSGQLDNGKEKKTTKVESGHTPNWRHI